MDRRATISPIPGGLGVGGLGAAGRADHPGMYVGEPGGRALSAWQGAGEPEGWEDAGVEAGHDAVLVAGEGEDDQPGRVADPGVGVLDVQAERGLTVGPGRDEAGPAAWPGRSGGQVGGGEVAAPVFQRMRGHGQRYVLGEQGDDGGGVAGLAGAGEPLDQAEFCGGAPVLSVISLTGSLAPSGITC